jgi:hypothetical protein
MEPMVFAETDGEVYGEGGRQAGTSTSDTFLASVTTTSTGRSLLWASLSPVLRFGLVVIRRWCVNMASADA